MRSAKDRAKSNPEKALELLANAKQRRDIRPERKPQGSQTNDATPPVPHEALDAALQKEVVRAKGNGEIVSQLRRDVEGVTRAAEAARRQSVAARSVLTSEQRSEVLRFLRKERTRVNEILDAIEADVGDGAATDMQLGLDVEGS